MWRSTTIRLESRGDAVGHSNKSLVDDFNIWEMVYTFCAFLVLLSNYYYWSLGRGQLLHHVGEDVA